MEYILLLPYGLGTISLCIRIRIAHGSLAILIAKLPYAMRMQCLRYISLSDKSRLKVCYTYFRARRYQRDLPREDTRYTLCGRL